MKKLKSFFWQFKALKKKKKADYEKRKTDCKMADYNYNKSIVIVKLR